MFATCAYLRLMGMIFIGVFTLLSLVLILRSFRMNLRRGPALAIGALLLLFQAIQFAYMLMHKQPLFFPIDNATLSSMLCISVWFMPNKSASLNRASA